MILPFALILSAYADVAPSEMLGFPGISPWDEAKNWTTEGDVRVESAEIEADLYPLLAETRVRWTMRADRPGRRTFGLVVSGTSIAVAAPLDARLVVDGREAPLTPIQARSCGERLKLATTPESCTEHLTWPERPPPTPAAIDACVAQRKAANEAPDTCDHDPAATEDPDQYWNGSRARIERWLVFSVDIPADRPVEVALSWSQVDSYLRYQGPPSTGIVLMPLGAGLVPPPGGTRLSVRARGPDVAGIEANPPARVEGDTLRWEGESYYAVANWKGVAWPSLPEDAPPAVALRDRLLRSAHEIDGPLDIGDLVDRLHEAAASSDPLLSLEARRDLREIDEAVVRLSKCREDPEPSPGCQEPPPDEEIAAIRAWIAAEPGIEGDGVLASYDLGDRLTWGALKEAARPRWSPLEIAALLALGAIVALGGSGAVFGRMRK